MGIKALTACILRQTDNLIFRKKVAFCYKLYGLTSVYNYLSTSSADKVLYLLKHYGATVGKNNNFSGPIFVENAHSNGDFSNLVVGDNCYIGKNIFLDLTEKIAIANYSVISANTVFITHADPGERPLRRFFNRKVGQISIGFGSWVGASSIIMPGVTIGEFCVIGAGTLIVKDVPSYTRVLGKVQYDYRRLNR